MNINNYIEIIFFHNEKYRVKILKSFIINNDNSINLNNII